MSIRSAQSITTIFTTRSPASGGQANADSLPTGALYVNGTPNGATVTVTNVVTGVYKAAVTLPTLAFGDFVSLIASATVSGVTDNFKCWEDTKDIAIDSSGNITGSVASVVGLTASNLDATISSRMAAYTQPTGFLAATFPTTVGDATAANQSTINTNVLSRVPTSSLPVGFTTTVFGATVGTGTSTLTDTDVRAAIGLSSANLDAQLSVLAIQSDLDKVPKVGQTNTWTNTGTSEAATVAIT